jgi:hypothetical protein
LVVPDEQLGVFFQDFVGDFFGWATEMMTAQSRSR